MLKQQRDYQSASASSCMKQIGIAGYGTVGRRVASAVAKQPDMCVSGVAKTSYSATAETALDNGVHVYGVTSEQAEQMSENGLAVSGDLRALAEESDIIIDCSPAGKASQNKPVYDETETRIVYQGGEDAAIADHSFNADGYGHNADTITDSQDVRVVSCNTNGLVRLLSVLDESYGVEQVFVTLVRRGGDPGEWSRGPINDIIPSLETPSHHGSDVNAILPDIDVFTTAVKVPATQMHMHSLTVFTETEMDKRGVTTELSNHDRMSVVPGEFDIQSAGVFREIAYEKSREYGSVWENIVWEDCLDVSQRRISLFQLVDQRSIAVPETVDAVRVMDGMPVDQSIERTNISLGLQDQFLSQ